MPLTKPLIHKTPAGKKPAGRTLADKSCIPCSGGIPALRGESLVELLGGLRGWNVVAEHHLLKTYSFPDFQKALDFVNRAGAIAEQQGHHPDLLLGWGRVETTIYTHKVNGLTESDFILAAKLDRAY